MSEGEGVREGVAMPNEPCKIQMTVDSITTVDKMLL